MSKAVEIKMYKIMKPSAVCGSEIWDMTEIDMKGQGILERKILRRIQGPMVEQGVWRILTNQELRELYMSRHSNRY
jgi:hypothetical protein